MSMPNSCKIALRKADPPIRYLTKSLVRTALTCPRKLVYAANPDVYARNYEQVADPLISHLSEEGKRFGIYCQSLFPHGTEILTNNAITRQDSQSKIDDLLKEKDGTISESAVLVDDLVAQTRFALLERHGKNGDENIQSQNQRVTLFEGAVTHGAFYVRPDILDKIVHEPTSPINNDCNNEQIELRVIEVKSKVWDSRHSIDSKMWTANKKSIKSTFLRYIQDVAFQTMVVRRAFPQFRVTSWLMMPDRAKQMNLQSIEIIQGNNTKGRGGINRPPLVQDTMDMIDNDSVAALLNIDDLVEKALHSKVSYPGGIKDKKFKDVVEQWAEILNQENFGLEHFAPPPIGTNCGSCEYRLNPKSNVLGDESDTIPLSGFDVCWQQATSLEKGDLQKSPLVVDLFGSAKDLINKSLLEKKYFLSDLSARDFGLKEDGTPLEIERNNNKSSRATANKVMDASDYVNCTISGPQRRWYQVLTAQNSASNPFPQYILKRKCLEVEMKKWRYPLHFIDFETAAPILPYYQGMSPYSVFAFQFSHHTMLQNDDGLEVHHSSEFLHTERGVCPNKSFLRALSNAVGNVASDGGTVFRWSAHENTVLSALLSSPECSTSLSDKENAALAALLNNGSHPMVDLCKLAQDFYYVDGSGGSSSIKRLLTPTLNASGHLKHIYGTPSYNGKNFHDFQWFQVDECGRVIDPYEILVQNIQNNGQENDKRNSVAHGVAASAAFHELQQSVEMDENNRKSLESSLLRYCELDTLAMVMIVQAWQGFLGNRT